MEHLSTANPRTKQWTLKTIWGSKRQVAVLLAWITVSAAAYPAAGAELPGLLFHLSFDRQTVTADFAAGEGRAPSIADSLGWKFASADSARLTVPAKRGALVFADQQAGP